MFIVINGFDYLLQDLTTIVSASVHHKVLANIIVLVLKKYHSTLVLCLFHTHFCWLIKLVSK